MGLLPEENESLDLYEVNRGCRGESPSLTLVGRNNRNKTIDRECGVDPGGGPGYSFRPSQYNAISADGSEVFFTTCTSGNVLGPSVPHQLFVRLGGSRALEVSRPLEAGRPFGGCVGGGVPGEVPCDGAVGRPSADFVGASEDGSRVFFTTTAALTSEDHDTASDLYLAGIGCPQSNPGCAVAEREVRSLVQISHDPNPGEAAEVQGVLRVAPDGARLYFVARGVLSDAANAEGNLPLKDADNLYVYDAVSGKTTFIADLCSGSGLSGQVQDARCPEGSDESLWAQLSVEEGGESQTAGQDAGFLVFSTYAQLSGDDADTARDVYRYDAATGTLERVSLGEDGSDANGNDDAFDARIGQGNLGGTALAQSEADARAVSEDGSRIVFMSEAPLSSAATNHLTNVYEWHEQAGGGGVVSLISTGSGEHPVNQVVISPSGNDIFFLTFQGLVAGDTDGAADIYDARLHGGFPTAAVAPAPCSGDACQGALTNPAPLLVPGSVAQAPGENLATPASAPAVTPKKATVKRRVAARADRAARLAGARRRSASRARRGSGYWLSSRPANRRGVERDRAMGARAGSKSSAARPARTGFPRARAERTNLRAARAGTQPASDSRRAERR